VDEQILRLMKSLHIMTANTLHNYSGLISSIFKRTFSDLECHTSPSITFGFDLGELRLVSVQKYFLKE
jgi:hypothetical protein